MTSPAQSSEIADFPGLPRYSCPKCKSENVRLALLPYVPEYTVCGFLGYLIDGDTVDVWMTVSATCRDCSHEDEPYRFRHMPRGRPTAKKLPTPPYQSYVYTCPACRDADGIMCYAVNPTTPISASIGTIGSETGKDITEVWQLDRMLCNWTECAADEPTGLRFRWEPREMADDV
jgi:hypothetical protein